MAEAGQDHRIGAYVAPMVVFGVFTSLEGRVDSAYYPWLYGLKLIAVVATLWICRRTLADIRPDGRQIVSSSLVGLVIFVGWISLDKLIPYPHLFSRVAFNPFEHLPSTLASATFLTMRFVGLVLIVPVMEELFWRSFMLRYFTSPAYLSAPVGTFGTGALAIMVIASAIAHPEWLVAGLTSLVLALWLRRTQSLFAAVVAHGVANASLGVYVVVTKDWLYW